MDKTVKAIAPKTAPTIKTHGVAILRSITKIKIAIPPKMIGIPKQPPRQPIVCLRLKVAGFLRYSKMMPTRLSSPSHFEKLPRVVPLVWKVVGESDPPTCSRRQSFSFPPEFESDFPKQNTAFFRFHFSQNRRSNFFSPQKESKKK